MASSAKIQKTGDSNGNMDDEKSIHAAIEQIDAVQTDIDKLNEQASEEILKVEQSFNKKRQPFYKKRATVIETIPGFWLAVFRNHPQLSELIYPDDAGVLQHCTNLDVQEFDDIKSGYKITMTFSENEYFKNTSITKQFHITEPRQYSACEKVEWKDGKNFTEVRKKNDTNKRPPSNESFFVWFTSETDIAMDEKGEVIKDDIWPNPLQYYLASEEDEDGEDEEGDLEGEEEDDDDDLGEDEEDVEEDEDGE